MVFRSDQSCINLEVTSDRRCRLYIQPYTSGIPTYSLYTAANLNIRDGEWHHLAGVRRDGTVYLYLDGQERASASNATSTCSFDLTAAYMYVGRDVRTGETEYDGDLKEARLWSRGLTTTEIASIVTGKQPGDAEVAVDGWLTEHTTQFPPWTNSLAEAGYTGSYFLRSYTEGTNMISLVFEGLPRHTDIGLGALLAQLDSLDPVRGGDGFAIRVDGTEVLYAGLGFDGDEEPQVSTLRIFGESADVKLIKDTMTLGGENLFFCGSGTVDYNEHVYDLSLLEALQSIPHTGDTLLVELLGVHDADGSAEGFGVDQIELTVIPVKGTIILIL